jgi:hypothetical protein
MTKSKPNFIPLSNNQIYVSGLERNTLIGNTRKIKNAIKSVVGVKE